MQFEHHWRDELPGCFSEVNPQPLHHGKLFYLNAALARQLELPETLINGNSGVWWGASLLPGMAPVAQVYSGHQFGVWAGQLGDGRGLLLGEQRLSHGQRLDWHLKGAGKTPYSRMGDGRAVLRSTIREFLASEAMHALGIPTTRALSIATSSEPVCREVTETGAMLIRIADSHLRFGHFEHFCYHQQPEQVRRLTEFAIRYHWPELKEEQDRYFLWFRNVVKRTANLIAHWQSVGFAHGVMNTDNMSLLGLTLDYGPYGFMGDYRSGYICNHSDYQGRYAFESQPTIGLWNLNRLAQSLSSLLSADLRTQALQEYAPQLLSTWGSLMRQKLGLTTREGSDNDLLNGLFSLMSAEGADYTRTLRLLSHTEQHSAASPLHDEFIDRQAFDRWFTQYRHRLSQEAISDEQRQHQMKQCNPAIVLRNYLAQQVIEQSAQGNSSALAGLHQALSYPYDSALEDTQWFHRTPGWGKQLEVSCSS